MQVGSRRRTLPPPNTWREHPAAVEAPSGAVTRGARSLSIGVTPPRPSWGVMRIRELCSCMQEAELRIPQITGLPTVPRGLKEREMLFPYGCILEGGDYLRLGMEYVRRKRQHLVKWGWKFGLSPSTGSPISPFSSFCSRLPPRRP
uniref:Uncharacterized protein n=1 Tax=Chromera velia CCMP2878 TaxID=1169474 RepID=A0A0G4FA85_9ALVE|eukprot:Cvel_16010.t1-p1 / transcript=Cvel_16010.t1 / gene=Cvel_16010 / organism=Chromera_velia_CCMP2878 / gene_product=hypothetical protein / transcript_product=hypothetical protein / location=Cvel_scaffold1214:26264-26698(-) / protein_length=145 / sequence_SO=supercontig / SO=protein_coding / is_pseudo=false